MDSLVRSLEDSRAQLDWRSQAQTFRKTPRPGLREPQDEAPFQRRIFLSGTSLSLVKGKNQFNAMQSF